MSEHPSQHSIDSLIEAIAERRKLDEAKSRKSTRTSSKTLTMNTAYLPGQPTKRMMKRRIGFMS